MSLFAGIDCQHLSDGHALVCLDRDCLIRLHNRPSWFPCTSRGLQLQNSPKVPKLVILKAVAMFTASWEASVSRFSTVPSTSL
ncbi:hypothetical protein MPTK1_7g06820 [Marchantia polymorpha subsp. ruderalis]|uniref:Uncharacterized protein n=2 Tax=Marchantia polymorpha TaxID=3197 RepID=A0AAF6BWW2_MARPO|nr:hypothetical protein MARPO_0199s0009 [Marchantia polymorpha]BBN16496.1 hypothetical protein Mp_7g06820 [Marchantia polymorpha subsp. ruderalis]|eukprot:PTQ27419.1 hypothetical protein MARPO_0199s0009 [Marchantia polymorpha]